MPHIANQTPYIVEAVPLVDKDGQNVFAVITKGTYELRLHDGALRLKDQQDKLVFSDQPREDGNYDELLLSSDIVDYKPGTDVILVEPTNFAKQVGIFGWKVSLEVGPVKKSDRVRKKWSFGPHSRGRKPRLTFAGTYDEKWRNERMPLVPADFDYRYNQAAPLDQIVPGYLKGDEQVKVAGLYEGKNVVFELPGYSIVVTGNLMKEYFFGAAVLDTLVIWSDMPKINLVWRYLIRCRQKAEELRRLSVSLSTNFLSLQRVIQT
ncbi:MAG: DUF2169 domain-containing protein [Nitrospira defluvii]|nr:DUF2169 domain-containing protein [Nitrospira defluvii]